MFAAMNSPVKAWRGLRVWLIGGSSGIGAALATEALQAGAIVTLSARRQEALQTVANSHPNSHVVAFDATDIAAWQPAYQQVCQRMGQPDLFVFCVADYRPESVTAIEATRAEYTLKANLVSLYAGLEQILPDMLARASGGIAVVASVAGLVGLPNAGVYGPSKAALINLTEILYSELRPQGISVYLINPGFVKTALTAKNSFVMPALLTAEQAAREIMAGITAGKFEIHFPRRFTQLMKLLPFLPYRLRFALFTRYLRKNGK